jgi:tetratricopeptide (TPR) repeat protein
VKLAEQLEPLSATINSDAGWFYFRARRFDEAIAVCRRAIEIEPTFSSAQTCIIDSLIHQGRYNEAWREARGFLKSPEEVAMTAKLTGAEPKEAIRKIRLWRLEQLRLRAKSEYVPPYQFVSVYAGLGERDSAFEWLEKGYVARDRIVLLMKVHPMFDELRSDPRFDNLMRRVGLPVS